MTWHPPLPRCNAPERRPTTSAKLSRVRTAHHTPSSADVFAVAASESMRMALKRITILISGRGSNMAAVIDAATAGRIEGAVTHVISNRADAGGLNYAKSRGIATSVVEHRAYPTRDAFDASLADAIDFGEPDLIVLAGFMRILGADFVQRYEGRMLNIHPSLLPAYAGTHTHERVLKDRGTRHGCTVHFVTPDVDGGPIVAQAEVPVLSGDDAASLAARVLKAEHRLLPEVVGAFCAGRIVLDGDRVRVVDKPVNASP